MATPLLTGLRVLDLSLWQPGQYATRLLADLGADVVKVEPPGGDRIRPDRVRFDDLNAGKSSVVLDLKQPAGRATLRELVAGADVVVENFRTGVAERLGVGFAQLTEANPAIVLCSVSGYGRTGPLSAEGGHELTFQAHAGAMTSRGDEPPLPMGRDVAGRAGGLAAAFAVLAAVLRARQTGEGDHVDVSITDLLASWITGARPPVVPMPPGAEFGPAGGTFRTADGGWVALGVYSEDHYWDALCRELGLDGHAGLTASDRIARAGELRAVLVAALATRTRDELLPALAARGVPAAPVRSRAEVLEHPHFRERGVLVAGPDGGVRIGHPVRYAAHPALPPRPAPPLAPG
ncbi:CaiB/BaiF CoA transferase family protein [Trujillonella humicola]|uniref:CaiB/BaiF CoA transferase family protein n=1 Tax=Trujillonella humicola TaxID=3383699 RepID=UPI0039059A7F